MKTKLIRLLFILSAPLLLEACVVVPVESAYGPAYPAVVAPPVVVHGYWYRGYWHRGHSRRDHSHPDYHHRGHRR